jgi:hypothetical protein
MKPKTNNRKKLGRCRKWKAIFGRITGADVSMSWIFSIIAKRKKGHVGEGMGRLFPMQGVQTAMQERKQDETNESCDREWATRKGSPFRSDLTTNVSIELNKKEMEQRK